ncbi:MAG: HD-GYP domain-containing protein [Phycisphaerales bacterium]|nr:HD-GYP domain-containing protein [Phycisphaerales bacterium]
MSRADLANLFERSTLTQSLRQAGLIAVACETDGSIATSVNSHDWLGALATCSGLVQGALRDAVPGWLDAAEPDPLELVAGVWCIPVPVHARRRQVGWITALVVTDDVTSGGVFAALCQAAKLDMKVTAALLEALPAPSCREVGRLAVLVRSLCDEHARARQQEGALETVGQELSSTYEEISLLYSVTGNMTLAQRPDRFAAWACEELLQTLPYSWVAAWIDRAGRGDGELIVSGRSGPDRTQIRDLARRLLLTCDGDAPVVAESAPLGVRLDVLGAGGIAQPVTRDGRVIGVLLAGDKTGEDTVVSSVDAKLIAAAAAHVGIFLENAGLYEELNAMFLGTLDALTASIDAKDRYTSGHSSRVAMLTRHLARAIGLDDATAHRMHIAGLVHDVGKIGVPEAVLRKPGRLTDAEFEQVKQHPAIGHRILRDIPNFDDILGGVLHHHERWDGAGYPHGISGEDIPLAARLIALADTFDAMCSTRTYRQALTRTSVLDEIARCAGTQFDPELVPVFLSLDFTAFDRMVAEHRAADGHQEAAA